MPTDVTYVGKFDAVEIETRPGVFVTVKQGETLAVLDVVARGDEKAGLGGLLDQPDNWQPAAKAKPAKS